MKIYFHIFFFMDLLAQEKQVQYLLVHVNYIHQLNLIQWFDLLFYIIFILYNLIFHVKNLYLSYI